jgi:hypothetical protein
MASFLFANNVLLAAAHAMMYSLMDSGICLHGVQRLLFFPTFVQLSYHCMKSESCYWDQSILMPLRPQSSRGGGPRTPSQIIELQQRPRQDTVPLRQDTVRLDMDPAVAEAPAGTGQRDSDLMNLSRRGYNESELTDMSQSELKLTEKVLGLEEGAEAAAAFEPSRATSDQAQMRNYVKQAGKHLKQNMSVEMFTDLGTLKNFHIPNKDLLKMDRVAQVAAPPVG